MSTCLVTGGAGFIGCAISAGLVSRFGRVVAMDNLHPQVHARAGRPAGLHGGVELMRLDITEPADWDRLLADCDPDIVLHLAAETGTGQSITEAARHALLSLAEAEGICGTLLVAPEGFNGTLAAESRASLERLVEAEIPVMGHLGLTPQAVNRMGLRAATVPISANGNTPSFAERGSVLASTLRSEPDRARARSVANGREMRKTGPSTEHEPWPSSL